MKTEPELLTPKEKKQFLEEQKIWHEEKYFNEFWYECVERIDNDDDVILPVCGQRRTGKSTFACQGSMYGDPKWTPWNGLVFTIDVMLEKVETAKKGDSLFWDEIGGDYSAYRFMTTESVAVTTMLEMVGDKNLMLNFTAPGFKSFAKGGRKNATHFASVRRYDEDKRGYARVFKIWYDDWDNKIGRSTLCDIYFEDLPKPMYEVYDRYKRRYLKEVIATSRKEIFLSKLKRTLPHRVYEVFFAVYINDPSDGVSDGVTFTDLGEMFPSSTVAFAVKVLEKQDIITKASGRWIVEPSILPISPNSKNSNV
jgi:hypothetical protein